jgi:hypothetical protein
VTVDGMVGTSHVVVDAAAAVTRAWLPVYNPYDSSDQPYFPLYLHYLH